ncbi:FAD-binding oxidoreductase [Aspergillus homomorphus CBS 101889]|uniref:FAD binding oxidoreductase n=1 Tax=Aspergillus homomorphus (strain CBS 101889) TaxID=1450537 RepID=A0A395HXH8_ASPHC|nr:FAD binding oxidoreductase [Aspergillus homomorphus CBS 101889]RAL12632.1 FAD binding oxidoreductase [Aspergillus homomorphus CBS 101889]
MPFLPLSQVRSLRNELDGTNAEISTWGCEGYGDNIKQWSDSCDEDVGAVIRVTSAHEAAIVVKFVTCHQIPLAVRGGGYSTSGSSTARGGIVLDLAKLRKVQVDPVSRVVTAEGGALWADIDVAAAQHGLAVVGSTLSHIGAAGATLGGGYGWLTGQYGLAIDNLLWAKVVLADGRVVIASEDHYPDLFWAIRGAGQEFGVAVELGFRAHPQRNSVYAGTLLFSHDNLSAVVDFANHFETITDGKQGLWFGSTMVPSMTQCCILVVVFYNGDQEAAERFFAPLLSAGPLVNGAGMIPYDSLNGILNTTDTLNRRGSDTEVNISYPLENAMGPRKSMRGSNVTLPLDLNFVQSVYDEFNGVLTDYPQTRDSRLLVELLPNAQIQKTPLNATAFANRGPYYNVSCLFRWYDPGLDERIRSLQASLLERIALEAGIKKPGHSRPTQGTGIYANYAGHEVSTETIFGLNYPRLQELKKKFDPHNTFNKWHRIRVPQSDPR